MMVTHRYGRDAGSYHHALEATQHYWNTCWQLTGSALEREVLLHPLSELLAILTSFLPKRTHSSVEQVPLLHNAGLYRPHKAEVTTPF